MNCNNGFGGIDDSLLFFFLLLVVLFCGGMCGGNAGTCGCGGTVNGTNTNACGCTCHPCSTC